MAQEFTISTILKIAQLSQGLANVGNTKNILFKSQTLDPALGQTIFNRRKSLQLRYLSNPTDVSLRGVAEYVLKMCGPFSFTAQQILNALTIGLPVLTGPTNQSTTVGNSATFSVSVSGTGPFTYQWYLNNVIIPGATSSTYTKTNAQLTDSGTLYSVSVTNSAGTVFSNTATLTVTAALVGFFAYMNTDPGPTLQSLNDPFTYQVTFNITHNSPLVITLPGASTPNKYLIVKGPVGESIKTTWNNTVLNNGTIPDSVWQNYISFSGWTYYYTRVAASMDTSQTLTLN